MSESKGFYEIGNTGNGYLVTYHTCERGGFIHRQGDQGTVVASVKTLEEAEKIVNAENTKATVAQSPNVGSQDTAAKDSAPDHHNPY